ncbi:hypothetical protein I4F81_000897 [Pyropia yezoensis]|uniref:Uncharacterized protein n=1 Tax=Pyropia yezoensis TaxID=2788 RepID=A0ACC3BL27_PYRYE|nr:hypothetical protein I4F81_000897 [Neopyropia yezoensis]
MARPVGGSAAAGPPPLSPPCPTARRWPAQAAASGFPGRGGGGGGGVGGVVDVGGTGGGGVVGGGGGGGSGSWLRGGGSCRRGTRLGAPPPSMAGQARRRRWWHPTRPAVAVAFVATAAVAVVVAAAMAAVASGDEYGAGNLPVTAVPVCVDGPTEGLKVVYVSKVVTCPCFFYASLQPPETGLGLAEWEYVLFAAPAFRAWRGRVEAGRPPGAASLVGAPAPPVADGLPAYSDENVHIYAEWNSPRLVVPDKRDVVAVFSAGDVEERDCTYNLSVVLAPVPTPCPRRAVPLQTRSPSSSHGGSMASRGASLASHPPPPSSPLTVPSVSLPPASSKIVGGWFPTAATADKMTTAPGLSFMVAVFVNNTGDGFADWKSQEPTCSGIVVHPRLVLTAAHCGLDAVTMTLVIGGVERPRTEGVTRRTINIQFPHRRFVAGGVAGRILAYDIKLLELNEAIPVSIATPALLSSGMSTMPTPGVFVTAAGYGSRAENWTPDNPTNPNTLSSVDLPLLSSAACHGLYADTGFNQSIHGCAGYLDMAGCDTCQFDSGGPIFYRDAATNDAVVIGVTAWGEGCGRAGRPGVFTLISEELSSWVAAFAKIRMKDLTAIGTPAALLMSAAGRAPGVDADGAASPDESGTGDARLPDASGTGDARSPDAETADTRLPDATPADGGPTPSPPPPNTQPAAADDSGDDAEEPLATDAAAESSTDDGSVPRSSSSSSGPDAPSRRESLRVAFVVVTSVFAACIVVAVVSVLVVDTRWRRAARSHCSGMSGLGQGAEGGAVDGGGAAADAPPDSPRPRAGSKWGCWPGGRARRPGSGDGSDSDSDSDSDGGDGGDGGGGGGGRSRRRRRRGQRIYGSPRFDSSRGGNDEGRGPTPSAPVAGGSLEWMGIARLGQGEADLV